MPDDSGDSGRQENDPQIVAARARDAEWVRAALGGDADAFARLYDAWSSRVFDLVVRIVPNRHVAQDVCQDVFFAAWRNLPNLQDHDAFGGWLLRIARNTALNQSARESRTRAVDDTSFFELMAGAGATVGVEARVARADDPEAAVGDAEIAALVREVTAALDQRDAEVLDLQLRYDMTPNEIGEVIGVNRNAANQMCHRARKRFATAFGARMLWRGARPGCDVLDAELQAAGVTTFGRDAVRLADRHAEACTTCSEHRRTRLTPAALFSAVPVLAAPAGLRAIVAGHAAATPIGGAASTGGAASSSSSAPPSDVPPAPPAREVTREPEPADEPTDSRSRRPAALVAAAVVAVVLLVAGGLLLLGGGDDEPSEAVAARRRPADTTVAGGDTARKVAPTSTVPTAVLDPGTTTPPTTAPATTRPGTPTTTAPPAPPPPPVTPPVIAQLSLAPSDPMYGTWNLDVDSPLLTWQVNGADSVRVVIWFDDGVHGNQQLKVYSTAPSGSVRVCPGTSPTATTCNTPNGYYTFVVEATNAAGTVSSDRTSPPGFHVYPPIL
ncbi:MAG: sigma-70 family RNA polymerase sigma factor [Acidimicrobiia bacterium]